MDKLAALALVKAAFPGDRLLQGKHPRLTETKIVGGVALLGYLLNKLGLVRDVGQGGMTKVKEDE